MSVIKGLLLRVLTIVKPYFSNIILSVTPNAEVVSLFTCVPDMSIIELILRKGKSILMASAIPSVEQSLIA